MQQTRQHQAPHTDWRKREPSRGDGRPCHQPVLLGKSGQAVYIQGYQLKGEGMIDR